jgi:mannose-6-phosphate isomerase
MRIYLEVSLCSYVAFFADFVQISSSAWLHQVCFILLLSTTADPSKDNVVRAGLTPKLRDVDTLVSMLTYTSAPAHAQLQKPTQFAPKTQLYDPPIDEFSVLQVKLSADDATETHRPIEGPSLCVVTGGSGKIAAKGGKDALEVKRGIAVFIAAETEVEIDAGKEGLELYRAYVEA